MKKMILPLMILQILLCSCATRFDTRTWVSDQPGEPVKHTRVTHSMAWGIPALFPMDATITDGEFKVETKSVNVPSFDFDSLIEKD